MKKNVFVSIIFIGLFFVVSFMIFNNLNNKDNQYKTTDAIRFKEEYQKLNNELKSDGINKHTEINIIEDNVIKYSTYNEIMNILRNGTGVIYFGYPECPWCRNAVPELLEAAKETGLEAIYYFNDMSFRDDKSLDENGNIVTNKEGTEEYYDLLAELSEYLGPYKGLNDETIKRLYVPTVVFIKDGEIVGVHIGTVESQTDPSILLNKEQKKELQEIYKNYINKMLNNACDVTKPC